MNKSMSSGLTTLLLLALSGPLLAHHGTAGIYDMTKAVKVEGVVKQFNWRNPHSALFVDGSSDAGAKGTFVIELGAPWALVHDYGIPKSTFKAGDRVVINMRPSFANATTGQAMQSRFWVNGVEFRSRNSKE